MISSEYYTFCTLDRNKYIAYHELSGTIIPGAIKPLEPSFEFYKSKVTDFVSSNPEIKKSPTDNIRISIYKDHFYRQNIKDTIQDLFKYTGITGDQLYNCFVDLTAIEAYSKAEIAILQKYGIDISIDWDISSLLYIIYIVGSSDDFALYVMDKL